MIKVLEPGLSTTVQDMGRPGYYHLGIPPSGAADQYSFQTGNILLGNPIDFAALEITLLGPKLEFRKRTVIAITGAFVNPYLNDEPMPMWQAVEVQSGDQLSFTFAKSGVVAYICISGGIEVPVVLGSKSTYKTIALGGFEGRKLKTGDEIEIGEPLPGVFKLIGKSIPDTYLPRFEQESQARMVMGFASYKLADEGVYSFLKQDYTISKESNRVAYRCRGSALKLHHDETPFGAGGGISNVVDTAYPLGGIVLPNSEEVIVFLNDALTGGGFMTIGAVISVDLALISQLRPGSTLRFVAVTMEQALEIRQNKKKRMFELTEWIKR